MKGTQNKKNGKKVEIDGSTREKKHTNTGRRKQTAGKRLSCGIGKEMHWETELHRKTSSRRSREKDHVGIKSTPGKHVKQSLAGQKEGPSWGAALSLYKPYDGEKGLGLKKTIADQGR